MNDNLPKSDRSEPGGTSPRSREIRISASRPALSAHLGADSPEISAEHFVDESSERRHVRVFAVPEGGEILDDVMHVLRLRHLLVIPIGAIWKWKSRVSDQEGKKRDRERQAMSVVTG